MNKQIVFHWYTRNKHPLYYLNIIIKFKGSMYVICLHYSIKLNIEFYNDQWGNYLYWCTNYLSHCLKVILSPNRVYLYIYIICQAINTTDTTYATLPSNLCRPIRMDTDSKVHGANMGPTSVCRPQMGPTLARMNLAIKGVLVPT